MCCKYPQVGRGGTHLGLQHLAQGRCQILGIVGGRAASHLAHQHAVAIVDVDAGLTGGRDRLTWFAASWVNVSVRGPSIQLSVYRPVGAAR